MKNKGQVYTWDLVFSTFVFMTVLYMSVYLWNASIDELSNGEDEYRMSWLSDSVSRQLLDTAGIPFDWVPSNVEVYGLADISNETRRWKGAGVQPKIIDVDKLMYLIFQSYDDYPKLRRGLLGGSKFDISFRVSCVNQSSVDCLQGLPAETVLGDVRCNNGYNFTITDGRTDRHIWLEMESYVGSEVTTHCGPSEEYCSEGKLSLVSDGEEFSFFADPGRYNIWVRSYDDNADVGLRVGDKSFSISQQNDNERMRWNLIGQAKLDGETSVVYEGGVDHFIDAIFFTTDDDIQPGSSNDNSFGNPNVLTECTFGGNHSGNKIISSTKTGVFSMPLNDLQLLSESTVGNAKSFRLDVSLLRSGYVQIEDEVFPTTTTTTTLVDTITTCDNPGGNTVIEDCHDPSPSEIEIVSVDFPSAPLVCGQTYNDIQVRWQGEHDGDENYFGFFAENTEGQRSLLGACRTDEPDLTPQHYVMDCSITIPPKGDLLRDGVNLVYTTAENKDGFCIPGDIDADDIVQDFVPFDECIDYTEIDCLRANVPYDSCDDSRDLIDLVSVSIGDDPSVNPTVNCGDNFDMVVKWRGSHYDAIDRNHWLFFLDENNNIDASYDMSDLLGVCYSYRFDSGENDYEMRCQNKKDFPANPSGPYYVLVTGESDLTGCNVPADADSYMFSSNQITFIGCPSSGTDVREVVFTYFIPNYPKTTSQAILWTDALGGPIPRVILNSEMTNPPPGFSEGQQHSIIIQDISVGVYSWNIQVFFDDGSQTWLYADFQQLDVV